jgi:3-dehydroquinate synthase
MGMREINIKGGTGDSSILIGESIDNLSRYLPTDRILVITDEKVRELYGNRFPDGPMITIGMGEENKTLDTVSDIYRQMLAHSVDRSWFVVGIGGGLVCDVTGFAASTYLRGVRFGFVSTTLLSQVDASVGGKNGVNFDGLKNMVGVFRQPEFVICDASLLSTLPRREVLSGLGEIVKHAAISDRALFEYLEEHTEEALSLSPPVIEHLVTHSVLLKAKVVQGDETEVGQRRILNFGHTFGHPLELISGVAHGQAVAAGMVMAAQVSVEEGLLDPSEARRLTALIERLELPVRLPADIDQIRAALEKDKKRAGDAVHFVMLEAIGKAVVRSLPLSKVKAFTPEK